MKKSQRVFIKILIIALAAILQFSFSGCSLLELLGIQNQNTDSNANSKANNVLEAKADAYVRSNAKNKNFGKAKRIKIKAGNKKMESIIRFSIPSSTGNISSAKLKIKVIRASGAFDVYKTGNNWNEQSVTWK